MASQRRSVDETKDGFCFRRTWSIRYAEREILWIAVSHIRQARALLQMSREQLAKAAGITRPTLSESENENTVLCSITPIQTTSPIQD